MNQVVAFLMSVLSPRTDEGHERGATATEYAILVAFIALVIVVGVTLFGSQLNDFFNTIGTKVGIIS